MQKIYKGEIRMLEPKYNHQEVEKGKYQTWLDKEYFKSGVDKKKEPFTIVIPPPNVTGKLHLGHAWDTSLQDIITRFKRMQGFDVLWLPGMDHAGIATQAKVDKKLKDMGIKPREMDREEWMKHAWSWKEEYAENIRSQWAKLGLGLDYSKERFTLDEGLNNAVNKVFIDLYNKNLIYRGERIINWDPEAMTALSNEEVIYKEETGAFYHLKYKLEDSEEFLDVATTRPETLFGDTAVAVNPNDERYKHLIGKNVLLPIVNKLIPIVGDEYADPEFGTGCVKITPAHDPNDFEVGNRHNLERIKVINPDGTMNEFAGIYNGQDRFVCRKNLLADLEKQELLLQVEEMTHSVGHSERTDAIIEPYLSKQWFVKMETLSNRVIETQKTNGKVNFVPERFEKILHNWMADCHDWCISRQLWWGHQIPAWYKNDEVCVQIDSLGEDWKRDPDVLDTWFSSALWPFSTLGWPEASEDIKRYYPTNVLVTAYDIIFFWVARMIFQGLEFMNERPFKDCLIHGLIRSKDGRKMTKSLGNVIDPTDVIDEYGTDALRFYLTTSTSPGTDLRFDPDKVAANWNFINKIWNASRFVLLNIEGLKENNLEIEALATQDKWILTKLQKTIESVTKHMEDYNFHLVGTELTSFIWEDFCDAYIEMAKFNIEKDTTKQVLRYILVNILKLLHPFMPFVTDEIYSMLEKDSITLSSYPIANNDYLFETEQNKIEEMLEFIKVFRATIQENNIIQKEIKVIVHHKENELLNQMLKLDDKKVEVCNLKKYNASFKTYNIDIFYEKEETEEDYLLKQKQITDLKNSIQKREGLLSNENYLNKAPVQLVEQEKQKLEEEKRLLNSML